MNFKTPVIPFKLFSRNYELKVMNSVINKSQKNNIILTGVPGSGKTTLVRGLQYNFLYENSTKIIYEIRISDLFAAAKSPGDIEREVTQIFDNTRENEILFIDEIHSLLKPNVWQVDFASMLKTMIMKENVTLIGATTEEEFRKFFENDEALTRRFFKLNLPQASRSEVLVMLRQFANRLSLQNDIFIADSLLEDVYRYSDLLKDRYNPDAALDILDSAVAYFITNVRKTGNSPEDLNLAFENAIKTKNYAIAQEILISKQFSTVLDRCSVLSIVSSLSNIHVDHLSKDLHEKINELNDAMLQNLIGQTEIIKKIIRHLKRAAMIPEQKKPFFSCLFYGPTGVGKTEAAKLIAKNLFGSSDHFIQINLAEFQEQHSVARLIGAPPGYIGHEDGGLLVKHIRKRPASVILFDEIEKAHHNVLNLLLGILDEGELQDGLGKTAYFNKAIIIATSNLKGDTTVNRNIKIGFNNNSEEIIKVDERADLIGYIKNEILARFNYVGKFKSLSSQNDILSILKIEIERLFKSEILAKFQCIYNIDDLAQYLLKKIDPRFGVRDLKMTVDIEILDKILDYIYLSDSKKIKVSLINESIEVEDI